MREQDPSQRSGWPRQGAPSRRTCGSSRFGQATGPPFPTCSPGTEQAGAELTPRRRRGSRIWRASQRRFGWATRWTPPSGFRRAGPRVPSAPGERRAGSTRRSPSVRVRSRSTPSVAAVSVGGREMAPSHVHVPQPATTRSSKPRSFVPSPRNFALCLLRTVLTATCNRGLSTCNRDLWTCDARLWLCNLRVRARACLV